MKGKIIYFWLFLFFLLIVVMTIFFFPRTDLRVAENKRLPSNPAIPAPEKIPLPSLSKQLGQNFVVGIEGKTIDEKTKKILEYIQPAGIILYYRNFDNPDQFQNLIADLQKIAKDTVGKSYFIMIDEEPGGAARLDVFNGVFAFGTPDWDHIERGIKIMEDLGVNVDLAPIADFPFDDNSFIKSRVPAHDPEHLMEFNQKFIALLAKHKISATLKHFPGMGVFVDDPHKKLPYANPEKSVIDESLQIFKSGIDGGADFVMTGHGVYDDLDPASPATLSKIIATDLLQKNLGFDGLVITDDLSEMHFIVGQEMDLSGAAEESWRAGHNLVLFSHELEKTKEIFDETLGHLNEDKDLPAVITANYLKVMSLKNKRF
jgi:beta-N-acetylhexosaminidase